MTPKELKSLIKTLRSEGITHYKTSEIELDLAPLEDVRPRRRSKKEIAQEAEIEHHTEELASLLKSSDTELVDRLFPDHTNYDEDTLESN